MKHEVVASYPVRIFEFLQSKGGPADTHEIAEELDVDYEKARKALSRMVAAGTLIAHEKKNSKCVGIFSANPEAYITKVHNGTITVVTDGEKPPPPVHLKAPPRVRKRVPKVKVEKAPKEEPVQATEEPVQETKNEREGRAGTRGQGTGGFNDNGAEMFAYQRGYATGYNEAINHSQKDAYQAGKRVVIEGLLKLLKVDAKVLMA